MDGYLREPGSLLMPQESIRPTAVEPRDDYRIWLSYSDGAAGEVDLSQLAGRGVFAACNDRAHFASVHIIDYDAVAWDNELELCPDALYMQLTGKSLTDVMPQALAVLDDALNLPVPGHCDPGVLQRPRPGTRLMMWYHNVYEGYTSDI